MPVVISIEGTDKLRRKIRKVVNTIEKENHVKELAEYTEKVAKQLAPKDTGRGARGIHVVVKGTSAEVRSNDLHMYVMNYGRRAGAQQPSTKHVAGWASRHGFAKSSVFALARSIGKRGIRARRFMDKAATLARERMPAHIRETIKVKIERIWNGD